jgi:hypothetical protein
VIPFHSFLLKEKFFAVGPSPRVEGDGKNRGSMLGTAAMGAQFTPVQPRASVLARAMRRGKRIGCGLALGLSVVKAGALM